DISATKGDDAENTNLIIKEDSVVEESVRAKPEQAVDVQSQSETEKQPTSIKKKSKSRFYLYLILGFAVGVILINSLKREHTSDVIEGTVKSEPITVQVTPAEMNEKPTIVAENASDSITFTDEEIDTKDNLAQENSKVSDVYSFVMLDELAARSDKDITDADTTLYVIDGEIAIHVVADNERLAKIANDYYGSRKLWPYIARHNNLRKPYGIAVGMKLSIPKLHPVK
ncbi:MAG: LysM peptidoglycan-binding domain-containing protein, partial [Bacteroidaceae bacterium]|nr:LysM peptidoglycan-binding domain-containing protein [Bacteroidaceae bacterium]